MSRVAVIKLDPQLRTTGLDRDQYRGLLVAGLRLLFDASEPSSALRGCLPAGAIGMKTNCLARRGNSTPVALTEALVSLLVAAGYAEERLVIWERSGRELAAAGYALNAASAALKCLGTDTNGLGYSREFYSYGEVHSLVSRILTDEVAGNINLPVLKDHSVAGLSGALKNMYGAIHNPNKYHGNNCDPYCAHVNNLVPIRSKNRLAILDAVRVQYDHGPGYVPACMTPFGAIILSADPVAADRTGLRILEHLRSEHNLPALAEAGRPVHYLETAQALDLGTADLSQIELRVVVLDGSGRERATELF